MKEWNPEEYKRLVERTKDSRLREIMRREKLHIKECVSDPKSRTFIEAGAGTGRLLSFLSRLAYEVVAVEINDKMVKELEKRARPYKNVTIIHGDVVELDKLLDRYRIETRMPVVLSMLNTLGTAEGNPYEMLDGMKRVAKEGEMIITLFCKYSLKDWGVKMYDKIKSLVGEVDLERCDFKTGVFRSKECYSSKWWSIEDIVDICSKLETQPSITLVSPYFWILHADYTGKGECMSLGYESSNVQ